MTMALTHPVFDPYPRPTLFEAVVRSKTAALIDNGLNAEQSFDLPIVFLSDPGLCPIVSLPHELVFEITNWTNHPADILSLALTNRYFHSILLPPPDAQQAHHGDATWRHARQRMYFISRLSMSPRSLESEIFGECADQTVSISWVHAPIPKPYEGMAEGTLMLILWGPKVCMICKKTFNETPKFLGLNCFWCNCCDSYVSYLSIYLQHSLTLPCRDLNFITVNQALDEFMEDGGNDSDFYTLWTSLPRLRGRTAGSYLMFRNTIHFLKSPILAFERLKIIPRGVHGGRSRRNGKICPRIVL